jgi:hypothetical protein
VTARFRDIVEPEFFSSQNSSRIHNHDIRLFASHVSFSLKLNLPLGHPFILFYLSSFKRPHFCHDCEDGRFAFEQRLTQGEQGNA